MEKFWTNVYKLIFCTIGFYMGWVMLVIIWRAYAAQVIFVGFISVTLAIAIARAKKAKRREKERKGEVHHFHHYGR